HYLARLIEAGLHVAVAEQVKVAAGAAARDGEASKGLVERVVTRVVTPGTLAEPSLLRDKENNYLASVCYGRDAIGLAFVDVSTGEFACCQFDRRPTSQAAAPGDDAEARLRTELERLRPAEPP